MPTPILPNTNHTPQSEHTVAPIIAFLSMTERTLDCYSKDASEKSNYGGKME